ncbi:glycosyltransferase [Lysinibacillus sp. FSL H8-0500]|uniref:Uncharacterized protein n=1 Tax=Lysinibacillus macroides TaxID=33935 RepID=A0A0M9DKB2_9BACI|nr:glycosyltransferase [Lysinibacillus macroides]KOY82363.1 hypothetical protein ADM90_03185 [Lysinibacillus macroides]QPR66597.1 glycosyltransferase [Lysinibacillus macroides]
MRKILINLFSESLTVEDFEYFTNTLPIKFEVFNYQFAARDMFPDIVEAIIKDILPAREIAKTRIILQTNVVDLGHFGAKFYSELLDGVIIVAKNSELLTNAQKNFLTMDSQNNVDFMLDILQADSTNLRLHKVYMHQQHQVDNRYLTFLFNQRLLNDISPIEDFRLVEKKKLRHNLQFVSKGNFVETHFSLANKKLIPLKKSDAQDKIFYIQTAFGMYQFIHAIMSTSESDFTKRSFLFTLFEHAKTKGKADEVLRYILAYLDIAELPLVSFANYNTFCMLLRDQSVLKRQYTFLKKHFDRLHPSQVHALITNSLFYKTAHNQPTYDGMIADQLLLMGKINQFWRKEITLPKEQKRVPYRIAVVVGQFLSIEHGPTKLAVQYVNELKMHYPKADIKIFVEDLFTYSPNELGWLMAYTIKSSSTQQLYHRPHLHTEIDVYYSNCTLERTQRIQQDVQAIVDFQPSIIYKIGSSYNVVTDLLYPYFPIVSQSISGEEACQFVDVFTSGYPESQIQQFYDETNIADQEYISHTTKIEQPQKAVIKNRIMYGLTDSDFVMITVGTKLEAEITKAFVEQLIKVLDTDMDSKWLIVGTQYHSIINNSYQKYVDEKRILFIEYEEHLFDLYHICDIYVNPPRFGEGISGALAMWAKLPIITTDPTAAVSLYTGEENCIELTLFSQEILTLKSNREYYEQKANDMQNRITTNHFFEQTTNDLQQIFNRAIKKFEERTYKI